MRPASIELICSSCFLRPARVLCTDKQARQRRLIDEYDSLLLLLKCDWCKPKSAARCAQTPVLLIIASLKDDHSRRFLFDLRQNSFLFLPVSNDPGLNRTTPPPSVHIIPGIYIYIYTGWVGVGWRRHCKIRLSLRGLNKQGTSFLFWRSPRLAVELDHFCAGVSRTWHTLPGIWRGTHKQLHSILYPIAVSGSGHTKCIGTP